jgi:sigma-E factor negative regulatory protein RseA
MRNQISALVDGELENTDADICLQQMKSDNDLRETWEIHHLIGDALRGQLGYQLGSSFKERLLAEPTVLAPQRRESLHSTRWYALSAAAGVAAVAIAAWVALPQLQAPTQMTPIAAIPQATPAPHQGVPIAVGVGDYLLAHQRFSPSSTMQGVAPYVRTVSEER